MKILLILSVILFSLSSAKGQVDIQNVAENFRYFSAEKPSQKLYLHLDKDHYIAGEKMWFKAYLLDGKTHELVTDSLNMYVELINSRGNLVKQRFMKAKDGTSRGDFELEDTLAEGNYKVRAYTKPMRNQGHEFFFYENIYISNPDYKNKIALNELLYNRRYNRRLERKADNYEVSFYPESGSLVSGVPTRVAFRVTNELGKGIEFEDGEIEDDSGNKIAEIYTISPGLGVFEITPEYGEEYTASISIEGRLFPKSGELPEVKQSGVVLNVTQPGNEEMEIEVTKSGELGDDCYIVGHVRGELIYLDRLDFADGKYSATIDKSDFPAGVAQFAVLSGEDKLADRLVFIDNLKEKRLDAEIDFKTPSSDVGQVDLFLKDSKGEVSSGNFSVTVTGITGDKKGRHENALSYFLLSSEFSGFLDNPASFFDRNGEFAYEALDALLMTKDLERFSVDTAVSGVAPEIAYEDKYGITISGEVINPVNDEPVTDQTVRLRVLDGKGDKYTATTNDEGRFYFEDLVYPDFITVEITTPELEGRMNPRLNIDIPEDETLEYHKNLYSREIDITRPGPSWSLKLVRRDEDPYRVGRPYEEAAPTYGTPDQTIYVGEDRASEYRGMMDLLVSRVTGLSVRQGRLVFRDAGRLSGPPPEPIFFMDGTEVGRSSFLNTNPRDVYRIEVFRGASTAVFGSRGGGGAILAYTKRGGMYGQDFYEYQIAGFYTPKEFETAVDLTTIDMPEPLTEKTLLWKPELEVDTQGKASLSFKKDGPFDFYRVRVEGVSEDGKILSRVFYIER